MDSSYGRSHSSSSDREPAQMRAARVLKSAARHLETIDPNPVIGDLVAAAVDDDDVGETRISSQFAETAPQSLSLQLFPGGRNISPRDRVETSVHAMRRVVGQSFGRDAVRWLDGRVEHALGRSAQPGSESGLFGSGFDKHGVVETLVGFDLGSHMLDSLPGALQRLMRAALSTTPSLQPLSTVVRCGRNHGSQQVTLEVVSNLALADLKPLMDEIGVGHQHASLMSAVAFLLGARFTLPPGSAHVTLRPVRAGVEMRIDVMLERIPDPPPQLMSLLRLVMAERPRSLQALDRWLSAFTPEGFPHAGDVTVLSAWVRPEVSARTALFLRPAALDESTQRPAPRSQPPPPPQRTVPQSYGYAAESVVASSPWDPIAG